MRIAHLGTFDVANFGDLLLALVLDSRLRASVLGGELEIVHASPRGGEAVWKDAPRTLSLAQLECAGPFDAVILGGGHLVSALPTNLPDYRGQGLLRYTAYPALWLTAARIAARDRAPLIWNAPGVPRALTGRAAELLCAATAHCDYLAVRDETSARHLRASGREVHVEVVPDTAFEVTRLWSGADLACELESFFARRACPRPARYVAVHVKQRYLCEPIEVLAEQLDAYCRSRETTAVLLALGPCHGDDDLARRLGAAMRTSPVVVDQPGSLCEITTLLAHCDAYVGSSLHGLIVATAFQRPSCCVAVERPGGPRKFSGFLEQIGAPERLVERWSDALERVDQLPRATDSANASVRLDQHWRRVGEALSSRPIRNGVAGVCPEQQDLEILTAQAGLALDATGRGERLQADLAESQRRERAARSKAREAQAQLERSRAGERRSRDQLRAAQRETARLQRDEISLSGWLDRLRHGIDALLESRRWRWGNWCGDLLSKALRRRDPLVTDMFRDVFRLHRRWVDKKHAPPTKSMPSTEVASFPSVSIVIPVHNAMDAVATCLKSLAEHTSARHEVILVDDASDVECRQLLDEFVAARANARLMRHAQRAGYTRSANAGWRAARGEYVVLLNSDTVVTPGWLERLVACGESDPAIGLVGPLSNAASWQSVPERFDAQGDWRINALPTGWSAADVAEVVTQAAPRYPRLPLLNGFCLAVKRSVGETIGYFDEEAFPEGYGEENDYCLRASAAGFQLAVADDAYVFHAKSQSYGHARRQELTERGQQSLRRKHGERALRMAVAQLRDEPSLIAARERMKVALSAPRAADTQLPSVLFLLPVRGGGGGAHSVVQEAAGMRRLGACACVAIEARFADEFQRHYPAWFSDGLFFVYRDRETLERYAGKFDVVVATVYFSLRLLRAIVREHRRILPAYYVQDYEPRFFPHFSRHRREARRSYGALPGMVHFAKTAWIRNEVERRHGVRVQAVAASLDHAVYFPSAESRDDRRVRVAAMIRPSTPYRAAERTLRVLRQVAQNHSSVELHWFGADSAEAARLSLPYCAAEHWHGRLTREGVAELLRASDLFVDLSDYQAFGRTGLEAMACGAAVVVPRDGGAEEYAVDGENALVVDTCDDAACLAAVERLVVDAELRARLAGSAVRTAARYSIELAARSELELFSRALDARKVNAVQRRPVRLPAAAGAYRVHAVLPANGVGWPGSSHIRILLPLQHSQLSKQIVLSYEDARAPIPGEADAVVVQRTALPDLHSAQALVAECRARGRRLIVELDDDFWSLPMDHPERGSYRRLLGPLEHVLEHADLAIVPTAALARSIEVRTARVEVIPNALDERLWFGPLRRSAPAPDDGRVRFLLMGTPTHAADLELVAPAARRLLNEFGDRVRFEVIGCVPRSATSDWYRVLRIPPSAAEYPGFVRWLRRRAARWQVGLAPLRELSFNSAKSGLKFLDYSALGLACIASDVPAYQSIVRQLETGLLTGADAASWYDALRLLALNDAFRRQLSTTAREEVRAKHVLSTIAPQWNSALRSPRLAAMAATTGLMSP